MNHSNQSGSGAGQGRPNARNSSAVQFSARGQQKSIDLHIEELILRGFAPGDRYRIAHSMKSELSRLFAERGIPPLLAQNGAIPGLNGGVLEVLPGSTAGVIGRQLAQALYGGLTK